MVMPNLNLLPIIVDSSAPITINAQIEDQIKLLIALGNLQPGDTLPTVTQLAKHLGVNHNTIAAVYNYLIESGYLVAQRGKGTFVAHTNAVDNIIAYKELYNLLSKAFSAATIAGLSSSEFSAAAYAQAVMLSRATVAPLKLVFVECLQHRADLYQAIQSEIKLNLLFIHLEDLKAQQSKALKELLSAELVITTAPHQWEVSQLTAPDQEVIALILKPDVQLLTHLSSKPRNTTMLIISQEKAGGEEIKRMLESAGISHISFVTLDLDGFQQNPQAWSQFDIICTSTIVQDYVRQYSPQPEKVIVFNFSIDESNMLVLKARVAAIQLGQLTVESHFG